MLNPLISCIIYALEMMIGYTFFLRVATRKRSAVFCLISGLLLCEMGSFVNLFFQNNVLLNLVFSIIYNVVFSFLCFNVTFFRSLCFSTTFVVLNLALEILTVMGMSFLLGTEAVNYQHNIALLLIDTAIIKSLLLISCILLTKFIGSRTANTRIPLYLLFYPCTTTISLSIFLYIFLKLDIDPATQLLFAIAALILFISTVVLFIIYQHQMDSEREFFLVRSENERLHTEKAYYDILEQQNKQLMIYAHDAKNHLAAIQSISDNAQVQTYVNKLSSQLQSYSHHCSSGNKMLDVIINKYVTACEAQAITFSYDVKSCNLRSLDDMDLVVILGNLMDNALRGAAASVQKTISLSTTFRNQYDVLILQNSCDTAPVAVGSKLLTTKSSQEGHGLGLTSVMQTLKKYGGDYDWDYQPETNSFLVTVMIKSFPADI